MLHPSQRHKGGGRVIPLNRELRTVLLDLRRSSSGGRPSPFVVTTERNTRTSPQAIVNLFSRWYADLGFSGCSSHRRKVVFDAVHTSHTMAQNVRFGSRADERPATSPGPVVHWQRT